MSLDPDKPITKVSAFVSSVDRYFGKNLVYGLRFYYSRTKKEQAFKRYFDAMSDNFGTSWVS